MLSRLPCKSVLAKLLHLTASDENLGFALGDSLGRRALSQFYPAPGHKVARHRHMLIRSCLRGSKTLRNPGLASGPEGLASGLGGLASGPESSASGPEGLASGREGLASGPEIWPLVLRV